MGEGPVTVVPGPGCWVLATGAYAVVVAGIHRDGKANAAFPQGRGAGMGEGSLGAAGGRAAHRWSVTIRRCQEKERQTKGAVRKRCWFWTLPQQGTPHKGTRRSESFGKKPGSHWKKMNGLCTEKE